MLSYLIVGSGYRAEYYGRIARMYPDAFRALFLCRSQEKAEKMTRHTGIAATLSPEEGRAFQPDFIVVAVDREHLFPVAETWIQQGYPVVVETPVGHALDQLICLDQWAKKGARIVCCEQYHRYPILAAGLSAVREGKIGTPSSVYISLLHDYHAASIIRRALQVAPEEAYSIRGIRRQSPVVQTDSRYGAFWDGSQTQARRDMMHISFASGKEALYDFSSVQYRSFIRFRHLTVRGDQGEWSDTLLTYLDADHCPRRTALLADIPEKYRCLDSQALRDGRRSWSAELAPDTAQDEFAIASILLDMGDYLAGGPSPYPLKEALADAYFWLLLEQAAADPWKEISSQPMPWPCC